MVESRRVGINRRVTGSSPASGAKIFVGEHPDGAILSSYFQTRLRACALREIVLPPMSHIKLHIPGPVEVSEKTFRAFCSPMIGHRGQGFKDLYTEIQPQLQKLLGTKQLVYLSTSSAWGVMEGA